MQRPRYDTDKVAQARHIERAHPGWVVIWGPWAREFTAWHGADPKECRIVQAATTEELRGLIANAQLDLWRASPVHGWQSTPLTAGGARQA